MRRILTALALVLVALPAWSQSSGATEGSLAEKAEQAKNERAARKAAGAPPAKSFGNDDLKGSGSKTTSSSDAATAGTAAPKADGKADKAEKTDEQARAERREVIQKQLAEEQKRIALIEKTMADAQRELGDITNYTYGSRRASLQKFLDDGAVELTKAHEKVSSLEEEARKLGASASR
jgi:hypothetical protein